MLDPLLRHPIPLQGRTALIRGNKRRGSREMSHCVSPNMSAMTTWGTCSRKYANTATARFDSDWSNLRPAPGARRRSSLRCCSTSYSRNLVSVCSSMTQNCSAGMPVKAAINAGFLFNIDSVNRVISSSFSDKATIHHVHSLLCIDSNVFKPS